jgi:hypothetical protein
VVPFSFVTFGRAKETKEKGSSENEIYKLGANLFKLSTHNPCTDPLCFLGNKTLINKLFIFQQALVI